MDPATDRAGSERAHLTTARARSASSLWYDMPSLAGSPLAPVLGRLHVRGPARLLYQSHSRRPPRGARVTTNAFGDRMHVDLRSFLEWHVWVFGAYELDTLRLITRLVRPGDVVVDVGANVGVMTVRAARAGAKVVSIEADPDLVARLEANLRLNHLDDVIVHAAAASDAAGRVGLHRPAPDAANRGQASTLAHAHLLGGTIEVPAITIDSLGLDHCRLVKIDVEGAEGAVVRGAWDTIERCRPHVLFEMTPEYSSDYDFVGRLEGVGYELRSVRANRHPLTGRTRGPVLVPLDPNREPNVLATPR
jgi:FkbM family methyltransferase